MLINECFEMRYTYFTKDCMNEGAVFMEYLKRFELLPLAWKARVLPLNTKDTLVAKEGLEPTIFRL